MSYCRVTHLSPDESLEAGLEVVDAALVELGHLVQQLLVLGLKVVLDRPELLTGLTERGREIEMDIDRQRDRRLDR